MKKENITVLRKILYAVESGGQVYGKQNYGAFAGVGANTENEKAITIGAGQWYAEEARTLLLNIHKKYPKEFKKLDTAGITADLNKSWGTYGVTKTSVKGKCIIAIITSAVGIKCQDALMETQIKTYAASIEKKYGSLSDDATLLINGRYIRGFISPKYTDDTVTPVTPAAGKDLTTVAREVILGVWGNMPERKAKLEASGYNFTDVQNKVNELLNKNVPTPSKPQNTGVTKVVAGSGAASFDKSLAGSYVTTTGLYMRHGAGKNKRAMVLIPEGTKVQNYGYYTSYNGTKWLYIQVTLNGVQYTGFSCKTYLKKQ